MSIRYSSNTENRIIAPPPSSRACGQRIQVRCSNSAPERPLFCLSLARKCLLSLGLLVILPLSSVLATTYYVDSAAGLDTNNGTSAATPWQSLSKVNAYHDVPGDTILFKRGSSWSGNLTPYTSQGAIGLPITFDAYGTGANPLITGTGTSATVLIWSPKYFTFQNFTVTNDGSYDTTRCGIRLNFSAPTDAYRVFPNISILNNEIHHVRGYTSKASGGNPYGNGALFVELQQSGTSQVFVQNLLVQGNYIHDNRCEGFYMLAPTIYGSHPEIWATGVQILDNIFQNQGGDNFVISGATGALIEGNASYDSGLGSLMTQPSQMSIASMWPGYYTNGSTFQFNEVARTHNAEHINGSSGDSQAFDVDLGTSGTHLFQYNYTHDNEGGVIEASYNNSAVRDIIYRYNLSVNDARNTFTGTQISLGVNYPTNSAHIYNNVFYSTRQEGYKFYDVSGVFFYNNIFDMPAAIYPSLSYFSNNCYYGHTPCPNDTYPVVGDPQFVGPLPTTTGSDGYNSANTNIFLIKSTSPCINRGTSIASNGGEDFFGNPLYSGTYADIGAHEVVGGNLPAPAPVIITDDPAGVSASGTVTYAGTWTHGGDSLYYNSTKSTNNTAGSWVQFAFNGTNVGVFGGMSPGFAQINVSIDGGAPVLVNCYWPYAELRRMPLYQISGLTNSAHTIKVTTAVQSSGASWNTITIDSFQQAPGTPASYPFPTNVDDKASTSVVYNGTWTTGTGNARCFNGTTSLSSTVGDYVNLAFSGNGVRLYGIKAPNYGKLSIAIDGGTPTVVNCYQPTLADYMVKLYENNGLTSGSHTLRATVATKDAASTANAVTIDLFQSLVGGGPSTNTYDVWHTQMFGVDANLPRAQAAADYDGDGVSNLLAFALGVSPFAPTPPSALPSREITVVGGQQYLTLRVIRDPAAAGLNYSVEATGDLGNIHSWSSSGTVVITNTPSLLVVRDSVPVGSSSSRFLRLSVSTP